MTGCSSAKDAEGSPLFPPELDEQQAKEQLDETLRQSPRNFGHRYTRWTIALMQATLRWLAPLSLSGAWRLLERLGFSYKLGTEHLHSPDPNYEAKRDYLLEQRALARERDDVVLVYLDEMWFSTVPGTGHGWHQRGQDGPRAALRRGTDRRNAIIGALEATTAELTYERRSGCVDRQEFIAFLERLRERYDEADKLIVALDNRPVYFHPEVQGRLVEQEFCWPFLKPPNWPGFDPADRVDDPLDVQLCPLPTYSPWLNPIEKLWRRLREVVLHLHDKAEQWGELCRLVDDFLDGIEDGCPKLLRYVGLATN